MNRKWRVRKNDEDKSRPRRPAGWPVAVTCEGRRIAAARRLTRDWVPEEELPNADEVSRELARQRLTEEPDSSGGLTGLFGDRYDRLATLVRPLAAMHSMPLKIRRRLNSMPVCWYLLPWNSSDPTTKNC